MKKVSPVEKGSETTTMTGKAQNSGEAEHGEIPRSFVEGSSEFLRSLVVSFLLCYRFWSRSCQCQNITKQVDENLLSFTVW